MKCHPKCYVILSILAIVITSVGSMNVYAEIIPAERKIDWDPGVKGGIPTYPQCIDVTAPPYNAVGDGIADDTNAINSALADCTLGQAVFLPTGTYRTTDDIIIDRRVVLRGNGPANTSILSSNTGPVIKLTGGTTTDQAQNVTAGMTKGSTSITIASAGGYNIGDFILIDQLNDPSLVTISSGSGGSSCSWCSRNSGSRAMKQGLEVTGKNGNVLTVDPPLYFTFESQFDPEVTRVSTSPLIKAGIEDLRVEKTNSFSDAGSNNITFLRVVDSWVNNVESFKTARAHIRLRATLRITIRDSYFHHSWSYSGDRAYGVFLFGGDDGNTAVLVENNIFYYLRHTMIIEGGGSGNVFAYNHSERMFDSNYPNTDWLMIDMTTNHGAHPYMNLYEGNDGVMIGAENVWGSGSHNTFLRDHASRESEGEAEPVDKHRSAAMFDAHNQFNNVVGNVLCNPGCTGEFEPTTITGITHDVIWKVGHNCCEHGGSAVNTNTADTIIRHGNYDYITNDTEWDPTIADHTIPNSYYLDSKPAFFGVLPWPAIGPDVGVGKLPAKERFNQIIAGPSQPDSPKNLRVTSQK